jgi:7,8-dihydro-6-hydroxymethylpterin-pyrophosphokinase
MEALANTLTDNALTRYYQLRIKYLEGEQERLRNEARADYLITLDFWVYAQRMIETYVIFHKEAQHEYYLEPLKTILKNLEAHNEKAQDTAINRLRLEVITRCNEAIVKCEQITEKR